MSDSNLNITNLQQTETTKKIICHDGSQHIVSCADMLINIAQKGCNQINNDTKVSIDIRNTDNTNCSFNIYGLGGKKVEVKFSDANSNIENEDEDENDDDEDYTINRLTMIKYNLCMICGMTSSSGCSILTIGHLMGWLYCTKCLESQRLRKIVLGHINKFKTIPLHWLHESSNDSIKKEYYSSNKLPYMCQDILYHDDDKYTKGYLHFFRYSKKDTKEPIHSGAISYNFDSGVKISCRDRNNDFQVPLSFRDNETGQRTERMVNLGNIMANTQGFYDELISCTDLLVFDKVKIAFSDLSETLQNDIHEVYKTALSVPKTSFIQ